MNGNTGRQFWATAENFQAIANTAHVAYERHGRVIVRRTMTLGIQDIDVWRDGAPEPTYQGAIEGTPKGWRVRAATGKATGNTDLLRIQDVCQNLGEALTMLIAHRSHRPVKAPWDQSAAHAARPASLPTPAAAAQRDLADAIMPALDAALADLGVANGYFDHAADRYGIAIVLHGHRTRYRLMIPDPGSYFMMFRNDGTFVGGLNARSDTSPQKIAVDIMCRLAFDLEAGAR